MSKYGLCLGVKDYSNWRAAGWNAADLNYSTKCAELFAEMLISAFDFPEANVRIQRDAWCSKGNVLQAIRDLITATSAGDVVCVYFAGHGTRLSGVSPGGQPETDNFYEGICPHSGGVITDYDLRVLTDQLEFGHVNFNFFLDACHSGGMSPVEGAPTPMAVSRDIPGFQACRRLIPMGMCLPRGGGVSCTVEGASVRADEASRFPALAKTTIFAAADFDQFGWSVPALQGTIFLKAIQDVVNQSNFQIACADFLTQIRAQAASLVSKHVNSISAYSAQKSVPQLYGQRARIEENLLAPFTFSI
jgi:hypothetical protein